MKKIFLTFVVLALNLATNYGQGEVFFANRVPGSIDARVALVGTAHPFADSSFNADLAVLTGGGSWISVPGSVTPFRGLPGNAANGYITGFGIAIPGFAPGTSVQLRMRGFQGPSFDQAVLAALGVGESAPITLTLGGGVIPVPNMDGLQGFTIPEPSTMVLGVLTAAALLLRGRK